MTLNVSTATVTETV